MTIIHTALVEKLVRCLMVGEDDNGVFARHKSIYGSVLEAPEMELFVRETCRHGKDITQKREGRRSWW